MRRRLARGVLQSLSLAAAVCAVLVRWPSPLFAHSVTDGQLVIFSDRPIPSQGSDRLLRACRSLLDRSPLPFPDGRYELFITNSSWREHFYFAGAPPAGGTVYYWLARHAFLSGADFESGQLIKGEFVIRAPRTLAYYCAHELTHVVTGDRMGRLGYLRLPAWIFEGLADYVEIENRQSYADLRKAIGERPVDLRMMQDHGVYPRYRLLVTYFLEHRRWTIDQLLEAGMSEAEAAKILQLDGGVLVP